VRLLAVFFGAPTEQAATIQHIIAMAILLTLPLATLRGSFGLGCFPHARGCVLCFPLSFRGSIPACRKQSETLQPAIEKMSILLNWSARVCREELVSLWVKRFAPVKQEATPDHAVS
jgi:hypothetical protein